MIECNYRSPEWDNICENCFCNLNNCHCIRLQTGYKCDKSNIDDILDNSYGDPDVSDYQEYINDNYDTVKKPLHYNQYIVEVADLNDSILKTIHNPQYAGYFKTMSEYLLRAHLKNGLEDLKKLQWWLNRLINQAIDGSVEIK